MILKPYVRVLFLLAAISFSADAVTVPSRWTSLTVEIAEYQNGQLGSSEMFLDGSFGIVITEDSLHRFEKHSGCHFAQHYRLDSIVGGTVYCDTLQTRGDTSGLPQGEWNVVFVAEDTLTWHMFWVTSRSGYFYKGRATITFGRASSHVPPLSWGEVCGATTIEQRRQVPIAICRHVEELAFNVLGRRVLSGNQRIRTGSLILLGGKKFPGHLPYRTESKRN